MMGLKLKNIDEFISLIEKRPLMFIEGKRVDYLFYLLLGFVDGKGEYKTDVDRYFKSRFFNWSLQWVKQNLNSDYNLEGISWYHIFMDNTNSDEEALDLFFHVCKLFFAEYYDNQ